VPRPVISHQNAELYCGRQEPAEEANHITWSHCSKKAAKGRRKGLLKRFKGEICEQFPHFGLTHPRLDKIDKDMV